MSGLESFFHPASVAVVGASRTPGKAGHTVLANILEFGFEGPVYPVNPGAGEILGLRRYAGLDELPGTPDLLVAVLPREMTRGLMEECARAGVRHVIIPNLQAGAGSLGRKRSGPPSSPGPGRVSPAPR